MLFSTQHLPVFQLHAEHFHPVSQRRFRVSRSLMVKPRAFMGILC